jgi:hypothetical protein
VQKALRVADFGAFPDSPKCCTREVQAAIDAAVACGVPARVDFDKGVYRLDVTRGRHALYVDGASDLVVSGNGCEFLIAEPTRQCLAISNSSRVIVENLAVDFERLPHTQGRVNSIDAEAGTLVVELDPAYPDLDQPHFHEAHYKWGFIKDRDNPVAFKEGTEFRLFLEKWNRVGDHLYEIAIQHKEKLLTVEEGDPYVQISRIDGALFNASRSEDVTFQDLRLYASSNALFATSYCTRPNFLRIKASPREGRWLTSGADGIFTFSGREGPWVEDCQLEALGDDNLVIKGHRAYCARVEDARTFDLVHARARFLRPCFDVDDYRSRDADRKWDVRPGDTLTVMDPRERTIAARPVVEAVEPVQNGVRVRVDCDIPNLRGGFDADSSLSFLNEDCCLAGFVVRNNVFKSAVRFGFLLKSHDGLVEGNHFEGHSDQSICMSNTYQEFNGIPYNLLIRGNTFKLAGGWPVPTAQTAQHALNRNRNIWGAVQASVNWPVGQWDIEETALREIRNVRILDNLFVNWSHNPALVVNNGRHVEIAGNRFVLEKPFAETALAGPPIAVKIVNSTDVRINRNALDGPGLAPATGIQVTDSDNVVSKDNAEKTGNS